MKMEPGMVSISKERLMIRALLYNCFIQVGMKNRKYLIPQL